MGFWATRVPGIGEPALVLGNETKEDGFLTASEVEELQLQANVTVLSACQTGAGDLVTGEGVLGLSRAFLVAGSKAVVVSLWSVASKETKQLMVSFYSHLQAGLDPAVALRKAKLDQNERGFKFVDRPDNNSPKDSASPSSTLLQPINKWDHPYFWAGFILVGG